MKKRRKVKSFSLPMKFNPGLEKFEPKLPARRIGKKFKINVDLRGLIIIILGLILMFGILFLAIYFSI